MFLVILTLFAASLGEAVNDQLGRRGEALSSKLGPNNLSIFSGDLKRAGSGGTLSIYEVSAFFFFLALGRVVERTVGLPITSTSEKCPSIS